MKIENLTYLIASNSVTPHMLQLVRVEIIRIRSIIHIEHNLNPLESPMYKIVQILLKS